MINSLPGRKTKDNAADFEDDPHNLCFVQFPPIKYG